MVTCTQRRARTICDTALWLIPRAAASSACVPCFSRYSDRGLSSWHFQRALMHVDSSSATYIKQGITSSAVCGAISAANILPPMKTRRALTPEETSESQRLKAIYEQRKAAAKAAGSSLTQADVADACGWSGQSAFSQYATGKVPLNVEALLKLSKTLGFDPSEVSPRLMRGITNPQSNADTSGLQDIHAWDEKPRWTPPRWRSRSFAR